MKNFRRNLEMLLKQMVKNRTIDSFKFINSLSEYGIHTFNFLVTRKGVKHELMFELNKNNSKVAIECEGIYKKSIISEFIARIIAFFQVNAR
jgi:hypothetical protein